MTQATDHEETVNEPIRAACETMGHFEDRSYSHINKYRNSILLPEELFDKFDNLEKFGYVRACPKTENISDGAVVQVASFAEDHDTTKYTTEDELLEVCVRTSLQEKIGFHGNEEDKRVIKFEPIDQNSIDNLKVARLSKMEQSNRDVLTHGSACYIHENRIDTEKMPVPEGGLVEVFNPENGSRILLPVFKFRHKNYSESWIRLSGHTRKLLGVEPKDEETKNEKGDYTVNVRYPLLLRDVPKSRRYLNGILEHLGRLFIDYSTVRLRVGIGRDRDEDRGIVRVNEDVMDLLGIEENDKILLKWNGRQKSVRCLNPPPNNDTPSDDDIEHFRIRVPSTLRDELGLGVEDCVEVRRDMKYVAGKKMAFSVFGIIGVLVGMAQVFGIYENINQLTTITAVLVVSIFVVWLILLPERQRCR